MSRKSYRITKDGTQVLDLSIAMADDLDEGQRSEHALRTYLDARFREKTEIVYTRQRSFAIANVGDTVFVCREAG